MMVIHEAAAPKTLVFAENLNLLLAAGGFRFVTSSAGALRDWEPK